MSYALYNNLRRSRSFRIAAVIIGLFLLSTLAIGYIVNSTMERFLERQAFSYVESLMADALDHAREVGYASLLEEITERSNLDRGSRDIYVLYDRDCIPTAGEPGRLPPSMLTPDFCDTLIASGGKQFVGIPHRHTSSIQGGRSPSGRVIEAAIRMQDLPEGQKLLVVLVVPEIIETHRFVSRMVIWSMAIVFVLGVLGAIFLAQMGIKKLERINALSIQIRRGNLALRIPLDGSGDEFDNLAMNLNTMLDRIESLLESSRQVTNDIAHDLRTPLTRLRTRLEKLGLGSLDETARQDLIDLIIDESDAILGMFDALLKIAGIEAEEPGSEFVPNDVSEILEDVADLLEPLASEKKVNFHTNIEQGIEVVCERNLLFQAFANIIENAIKYTPATGRVDIYLERQGDGMRLVVRDSGPGIPINKRDKVFQRFYRMESNRSSPGNGLGLSLVKAIADSHSARIELGGDASGLKFTFSM
jgi:signal transduction histidine kinase